MPGSLLFRYSPLPGGSVPLFWVTRYCSGDRPEMASVLFRYSDTSFLLPLLCPNLCLGLGFAGRKRRVMNPLLLAVSSSVSDLTNRVLPNLNRSYIQNTSPTVSVTRH